jgi:hypothetical protein
MLRLHGKLIFAVISFIIPFCIFLSNASFHNLGFADASEFALVTKFFGIAHPPGFPSYVLFATFFSKLIGLSGLTHVSTLVIFSSACVAFSCMLLYLTSWEILSKLNKDENTRNNELVSLIASIVPAAGSTIWHWAHSVEVYGFQLFASGLLIYGVTAFEIKKEIRFVIMAAFGYALGLANHHLSMILFSPFLLLLLSPGWLDLPKSTKENSKKKTSSKPPFWYFLKEKSFLYFSGTTLLLLIIFYGWMMVRAATPLYFAFGSPDNLSRLFYHLSGGAWIKNTQAEVKGIIGMRFPYFMSLKFGQFLFFLPVLIAGIIALLNKKLSRLLVMIVGYYLLVLIYQLRIDQTADTDAYMVTPFYFLCLLLPFGILMITNLNKKLIYLFPLLIIFQFFMNYPKTDLTKFDLSDSLMKEIDRAAPKGSVILIADWTSIITYTYYRNEYNFRPDLFVLNYDLKFTYFKLLERNYPPLYKAIKPEYDRYINLLGEAHPAEIYNTGCSLDNPQLLEAYLDVIKKLQSYCRSNEVAFMADPKAYVTLNQYGVFKDAYVSGCLVSNVQTGKGNEFTKLDFHWLNEPRLSMEPAAADKLVDLEAALDFNRNYYTQTGETNYADAAENSYQRIKRLQREMKKNMPFLFRPHEQ